MVKKFLPLRWLLTQKGMKHEDVARRLGIPPTGLSARLCGKTRWTVDEAMQVCDLLSLDYKQIGYYFADCKGGTT